MTIESLADIPGSIVPQRIVTEPGCFNGSTVAEVPITRHRLHGDIQEREIGEDGQVHSIPDRTAVALLIDRVPYTVYDPAENGQQIIEDLRADPRANGDKEIIIGTTIVPPHGAYFAGILTASVPAHTTPENLLQTFLHLPHAPVLGQHEKFAASPELPIVMRKLGGGKGKNVTPILGTNGAPNRCLTRPDSDMLGLDVFTELPDGTWSATGHIDYRPVLHGEEVVIGTSGAGLFAIGDPRLPQGSAIQMLHYIKRRQGPNGEVIKTYCQAAALVDIETLQPSAFLKIGEYQQLRDLAVTALPEFAAIPEKNPYEKEVAYCTYNDYLRTSSGTINPQWMFADITYYDSVVVRTLYAMEPMIRTLVAEHTARLTRNRRNLIA